MKTNLKGLCIGTRSGTWAGVSEAPSVEDAAAAMGRIGRFAGHGKVFWSVLVHSLIVSDLAAPEAKLYALIHDVTESMISDIPKPFKIPEMEELEARLYFRVLKDWGLPYPEKHVLAQVHQADFDAFLGEVHTIAPSGLRRLGEYRRRCKRAEKLVRQYMKKFPPSDTIWPEGRAVKEFLTRYAKLKKEN